MLHDWPDACSISSYSLIVYSASLASLGSPLSVCIPPAACHVDPDVSSSRLTSTTSVQPARVRWYRTLAPTTPPPITATRTWVFTESAPGMRAFAPSADGRTAVPVGRLRRSGHDR